jgi:hypothetical protein
VTPSTISARWAALGAATLMFILATALRLQSEPGEAGAKPIGWQRWWHQLLE